MARGAEVLMPLLQTIKSSPVSIVLGLLLGVALAAVSPLLSDAVLDEYDRAHPVWQDGLATQVERQGDAVLLSISGNKVRACNYLRINAQTLARDGTLHAAAISRVDQPEMGSTRLPGRQQVGRYRIVPVAADARELWVTVEHDCSGRRVMSKLVTVVL